MHIGFITSEYPHPKIKQAAGIGTSIKNLATALVKKNVNVTIFVYDQIESQIFVDKGVEIHLIKKRTYKFFTWYFYRKHLQHYLGRSIKTNNINLLEAPDWTGITAFMKFKTPLVIRLHGSDAYFCKLENRKQKFKNYMFEKLALINANAYIAPTTYAGLQTQKIFGLKKDKIQTIHYGLQLEQFTNNNASKYNSNTILYIGTIIRKKGVLELARVFNRILETNPEANLVLIGSDAPDIITGTRSTFSLMNDIFSKQAKARVNYLGKIPYSQVKIEIEKAHLCTFPSFAETLGMVTIESMALQKPVVNTSIGWAKELIDDGKNGYLVHPLDIKLYAERICTLLNDKDLCKTIGKAARLKVESTFDIEKQAIKNIEYYNRIIAKS